MGWNLTEEEQAALMDAAELIIKPYRREAKGFLKGNTVGFDNDAPKEVKHLKNVVDGIVDKGCCIGPG